MRAQFVVTQAERRETAGVASAGEEGAPKETGMKIPEIITEALNIFQGSKIIRKD